MSKTMFGRVKRLSLQTVVDGKFVSNTGGSGSSGDTTVTKDDDGVGDDIDNLVWGCLFEISFDHYWWCNGDRWLENMTMVTRVDNDR